MKGVHGGFMLHRVGSQWVCTCLMGDNEKFVDELKEYKVVGIKETKCGGIHIYGQNTRK